MKKMILCFVLILALITPTAAFSQDINDTVLSSGAEIDCRIANLSDINTVTPEDAGVTIDFKVKERQNTTYTVTYSLNGGEAVVAGTVSIEPEEKVTKTFKINAPKGAHTLLVNILNDDMVIKSFTFDFVVMEKYKSQFMDMYNPLGFCTHFSHYAENKVTNETSLEEIKFIEATGSTRTRDGFMPNRTEPSPGYYSFYGGYRYANTGESYVGWWLEPLLQSSINLYPVYSSPLNSKYYNDLPKDIKKTSREIRTTDSITGYSNFIVESLKQVPGIKAIEIHNEPNISGFWTSQVDSDIDYANLLKQAALTVREYSDDVRLDALSVTDATFAWTDRCMEYGAYPYFDAISYHPYAYHYAVEYKDTLFNKLWNVYEAIDRYGGWKEFTVTEIGQPTFIGNNLSEEEAAERTVKQLFMLDSFYCRHADIYALTNKAPEETNDKNDREDNFGLVKWYENGERYAKDGFVAAAQYSNQLAGAIFVGEIDFGDGFYGYLYNKDGLPKLAVWYYAEDGSTKELSFDGESVTATDIYGNVIHNSTKSIDLGTAPVYVSGLSEKWFARAVHEEISEYNARWAELYGEKADEELISEAQNLFNNAEKATENICDADTLNELADSYFEFGYKVLDNCKNGKISEKDASAMLFGVYKSINVLNNYYMVQYDGDEKFSFNIQEATNLVKNSYKNNKNIKQYTDALYRYVKRFANQADEVAGLKEDNPIKAGVVNGWNYLANGIYGWMKEFNSFETVTEYGITIRVPGYDTQCFVGETKNVRAVVRNVSNRNFTGTLNVYNEKGELIGQTEAFTMNKGQTIDKPVRVKIGQPENGVTEYYEYALVDNGGNKISVQKIRMRMQNSITVSVLPVNEQIKDVKSIKLKIVNNRKERYPIDLELATSENIKINNNKMSVVLEPSEARIIEIPVVSIDDTKFHCYSLSYKATDENGDISAHATQLLSFTSIVKASTPVDLESFNGGVSGWENAYPIYINQPQDASAYENWSGGNNASRAFLKWDKENLYMLTEVYDDVQNQQYTGTAIWQGDSVQIALDCLNTKSASYDDDDYEIGTALGSSGVDFWSWRGEVSGNMKENIKIVRDEDAMVTRYLMIMPKSSISNLNLAEGSKIGLNMAVNDADVYERDAYYQFSLGLAGTEGKHPSMYETFTLCNESSPPMDGYYVFK